MLVIILLVVESLIQLYSFFVELYIMVFFLFFFDRKCFNFVVYIYAQVPPHCKIFFPSVYDPNHQLFILNFRGLSFSFPIDSKFEVCKFVSQHCTSAYSIAAVNDNMKGNSFLVCRVSMFLNSKFRETSRI